VKINLTIMETFIFLNVIFANNIIEIIIIHRRLHPSHPIPSSYRTSMTKVCHLFSRHDSHLGLAYSILYHIITMHQT
jgi:hypothetical protein